MENLRSCGRIIVLTGVIHSMYDFLGLNNIEWHWRTIIAIPLAILAYIALFEKDATHD